MIVGNLHAYHWETNMGTLDVQGFQIGFTPSLIGISLSLACIGTVLRVRVKYKTWLSIKIILLVLQLGVVCVHVSQICVRNRYNERN